MKRGGLSTSNHVPLLFMWLVENSFHIPWRQTLWHPNICVKKTQQLFAITPSMEVTLWHHCSVICVLGTSDTKNIKENIWWSFLAKDPKWLFNLPNGINIASPCLSPRAAAEWCCRLQNTEAESIDRAQENIIVWLLIPECSCIHLLLVYSFTGRRKIPGAMASNWIAAERTCITWQCLGPLDSRDDLLPP